MRKYVLFSCLMDYLQLVFVVVPTSGLPYTSKRPYSCQELSCPTVLLPFCLLSTFLRSLFTKSYVWSLEAEFGYSGAEGGVSFMESKRRLRNTLPYLQEYLWSSTPRNIKWPNSLALSRAHAHSVCRRLPLLFRSGGIHFCASCYFCTLSHASPLQKSFFHSTHIVSFGNRSTAGEFR